MPHILVVDDEDLILLAIKQVLQKSNYDVLTAKDYTSAVKLLEANTFDTVITDIVLPGTKGTQLLQYAREMDPDLPVILITGMPAIETAQLAIRYKAFDYITKPLYPANLLHVLEKAVEMRRLWLDNKRLQQEAESYRQNLELQVADRTHQLDESRARYQDLFERATDPMFLLDESLKICDINQAGQILLGTVKEQILGQSLNAVLNAGIPSDQEFPPFFEMTQIRLGQTRVLEIRISRINFRGQQGNFYHGIVRDITERKRTEEAIRQKNEDLRQTNEKLQVANKIQSDLFNLISHELRTPLTIIAGHAEILRDLEAGLSLNMRHDCLGKILKHVAIQGKMIDQLLLASRLFKGNVRFESTPIALDNILRDIYETCQPDFAEKGLTIRLGLTTESPLLIDGYESFIALTVRNVLENALKFTPSGGQVTLSAKVEDESIVVSISDSGIGIQPEHLEPIFQQFYQVESSTTRRYGGLGLGLAIAKELIQMHQGEIHVVSTPGQGSTFFLRFPKSHSTQATLHGMQPKNTSSVHKTVLIVDDNRDVTEIVRISLTQKTNYHVLVAASGFEALALSKQHLVDLVVLDLMMPDMDGFAVCEKLRGQAWTQNIPIIILTGQAQDEERERALALGVNDYMIKPFVREALMASIDRLIARTNH